MFSDCVPLSFSKGIISSANASKTAARFDQWLYGFLADHFGVEQAKQEKKQKLNRRRHRGLERLRQEKKVCRRMWPRRLTSKTR